MEHNNTLLKRFNIDVTNGINTTEVNMIEESQAQISQKVLFIPDLEKMIGRNRMTLRRWWLTGKFPRPVKLNGTTLAWHTNEIEEWIEKAILNAERTFS